MDDEAARSSSSSSEFSAQARELIDALFADLRLLRAAQTGRERRALLDRAFRHAHTLKVTLPALARSEASARLAHALEDVLEAARSGRRALDDPALDACEDAADSLSETLDAIARGEDAEPAAPDARAALLLRRLAAAAETRAAGDSGEEFPLDAHARVFASLPEEIAAQLNAFERRRLSAVADEGARVVSVEVAFDLESLDEEFRRFGDALAETGEIVATLAGAGGDPGGGARRISFRLVCATHGTAAELAHRLAEFGARVELIFDAAAQTGAGVTASPTASVRVPLAELDDLAFDVSELFDDTAAALASARTLASRGGGDEGAAEIDEAAARLRESFLSLEERVLALRMRELAPALERAARAGRQAARAAGRRVEFETAGGDARIDRALAERVAGPLAHLLRNAVDHGIEPADERRAAGKSEAGRVRVEAATDGARVRLVVEDDGRGIDAALVERAARARGIVAEGASLEEGQALRLIFRPGFSTAAAVSETSGRGVGLDAVEREVEAAGGEVRVRTRAGRGTTFELHLPLALALAAVVLVESDGQTYALEAARVVETLQADESAAGTGGARRSARWRGQLLPLVSLSELLGRPPRDEPHAGERTHVVINVAGHGANAHANVEARNEEAVGGAERGGAGGEATASVERAFAVAVDGVVGRRDALVRSLGRYATRWRGVGGAVDLRDGTAALLLDLARLLEGREG